MYGVFLHIERGQVIPSFVALPVRFVIRTDAEDYALFLPTLEQWAGCTFRVIKITPLLSN